MEVNSIFKVYIREVFLRFWYFLGGYFCSIILLYINKDVIIYQLIEPLLDHGGSGFIFTDLTELFMNELKLTFLIGLYFSIPLFWIQILFFLKESLYIKEYIFICFILASSWLFFMCGIYCSLNYFLPNAWKFFLGLSENSIVSFEYLPAIGPYLNLCFSLMFGLTLSFQFPLFLFLGVYWGSLSLDFLIKVRGWFVMSVLVFAGLVSPPDVFSQLALSMPIFISYEICIFGLLIIKNIKKD